MSELCRFLGIIIAMFADDHNPPHIHVRYGSFKASITIESCIVTGSLPRTVLKSVFEWMDLHHDELLENWERLHNDQIALKIEPLKR